MPYPIDAIAVLQYIYSIYRYTVFSSFEKAIAFLLFILHKYMTSFISPELCMLVWFSLLCLLKLFTRCSWSCVVQPIISFGQIKIKMAWISFLNWNYSKYDNVCTFVATLGALYRSIDYYAIVVLKMHIFFSFSLLFFVHKRFFYFIQFDHLYVILYTIIRMKC